jgi:hypothetical protein
MFTRIGCVVILASSLVCGGADTKSLPSESELAEITARGRMLAEYDMAAWHATDAVQSLHPEQSSTRYYIARKTGSKWAVAFGRMSDAHDKFLMVYEADQGKVPEEFSVHKDDPPKETTDFYFCAATALESALKDFQGEQRPYNTYVFPSESGEMNVYILPAQTKAGIYPLGGMCGICSPPMAGLCWRNGRCTKPSSSPQCRQQKATNIPCQAFIRMCSAMFEKTATSC